MGTFTINGGQSLAGELFPQGAKNEALQILCATLLTPEKVTINNIPDISDVTHLIELIGKMGCKVEKMGDHQYTFQAGEIDIDFMLTDEYKRISSSLRGSIMILGPL